MPANNHAPLPAFSTELDGREWAGVTVLTRGAGVSLTGWGVFPDAVAALNGYCSQDRRDLGIEAQEGWDTAGAPASVLTAGINTSDRVFIQSTTTGFDVIAVDANPYGFTGTTAAALNGGVWVATATQEWARGVFSNTAMQIDPTGAVGAFTIQSTGVRRTGQSVPTLVRPFGTADADAGYAGSSLEQYDNTANDAAGGAYPLAANRRLRWGITDDGHVYTTRPAGVSTALGWNSTSFRDRLGFVGSETEVSSFTGTMWTLTATYPLPGFWAPTRALRRCWPWHDERTEVLALTSGDLAANYIGRWTGWSLEAYAGGQASAQDDERHLRDRFWRYAPLGFPLTVWQQWGDPPRSVASWQVTANQVGYSTLWNGERNGRRGRLRGRLEGETFRLIEYEGESGIEVRGLVGIRVRDRVD